MVSCEEANDCKPEEASSLPLVYYGPRMAMPPYFSSIVASGHAPPYMWGPLQHMMPPYAAIYPHGVVYAHPVLGNGNPTRIDIDSPAKSSGNSDQGSIKKLKGRDELTMSIGNNNEISNSRENEGSSEGSDGYTNCKKGQKRIRGGLSTSSEVSKSEEIDANGPNKKVTGVTISGKEVGAVISGQLGTELELKSPAASKMDMVNNTTVLQNERELKREKRKQSNRESARRSRLRKQTEAEQLTTRVESLASENLKLKSTINQLTVNSANLKLQNAKLLDKLKRAKLEQATQDPRPDKTGSSLTTANLISRVDNHSGSGSGSGSGGEPTIYPLAIAS